MLQMSAQLDDETALIPCDTFQQLIVPWMIQNERALKRDNFHTIVRALKAFDPDGKGWIDSQLLKTSLTTKVTDPVHKADQWSIVADNV
jgi:hypothetical protein